jgi:hypothetical protein
MKSSLVATAALVLLASRLAVAQDLSAPREYPDRYSLAGWVSLGLANHTFAAFDAASTRRSILAGNHEENPLVKPFANSNSLYVVTQIGPPLPDALGFLMLRSERRWLRQLWWLPQMANIAFTCWNAVHNIRISQ